MASVKEESLFTNIEGKELIITDGFYKLKGDYIHNENFFNFNEYEILNDINDAQTNNLSNILLSRKDKASNFLQSPFSQNNKNTLGNIKTTLCFGYPSENINNAFFVGIEKSSKNIIVKQSRDQNHFYIFDILELTPNTCEISCNIDNIKHYICYEYNSNILTVKSVIDKDITKFKTVFSYHTNGDKLNLYKDTHDNLGTAPQILSLNIATNSLSFKTPDKLIGEHNFYETIYIEKSSTIDYPIDASWVSYEQNDDINQINNERSHFSLDGQFILHHEYSTANSANIIPLKNNFTYKNEISNGESSIYNSNKEYIRDAVIDFKNYTSLSSGFNQEKGYDNIVLNFTFNEQTYTVNPGDDLIFTIPEESTDDTESDFFNYSLYPYKQLNLNDAPFIRNGSFGSDSPILADKIKYYSKSTLPISNSDDDTSTSVRYLCSWLYYDEERKESTWLDRYYYPVISKESAESKVCNLVDYYIKDNFKENLIQHTVYDRRSDITIKGGGTYKYERISNEDVSTIFNNLADSRVENKVSNRGTVSATYDEILLDGESWYNLQDDKLSNTNAIHFNTDIYINPDKKMGIQLFGCDMTHGFNIQNRKDLTPFYYYSDENSIYLYNNEHRLCKSLNLTKIYDEKIIKVIGDTAFKNLFVLLEHSIVVLYYDLSIKIYAKYNEIEPTSESNSFSADFLNGDYYLVNESDLYILINNTVKKVSHTLTNKLEITDLSTGNAGEELIFLNAKGASPKSIYFEALYKKMYIFEDKVCKLASDKHTIFAINETNNEEEKYILNAYDLNGNKKPFVYFKSSTSIDNISIGPNDDMILIRGFKGNNKDKQCFEIYDNTRNKVYKYSLSSYDEIKSVIFYRYIDIYGKEHDTFKLICSRNNFIDIILYHIEERRTTINMTALSHNDTCKYIVNDNNIIKYTNENVLYFNLYAYDKLVAYVQWDIAQIQAGWYNIDALIDFNKNIFKIKINDVIISDNLITYFHNIQGLDSNSIFDNIYTVGAISKSHGLSLSELLYNGKADPYTINNTKLKNLTLYNKKLNYHEQQASLLYFKKINPLILTLPCGVRNGIEEITRYFKYNNPGSVSNKIKINIAGLNAIDLKRDAAALKSHIIDAVQRDADCLVEIENIEFI